MAVSNLSAHPAEGHAGALDDGPAAVGWPSPVRAWWMVVVLGLALTLSMADRLIIALMIEPIKSDLRLSDTDVALIQGFAFTALYVVAGLPLGRMADGGNRRIIAAASVFVWSGMTALCGLAGSFNQLFAARLGVGVGEAGLSPAAVSLVGDSFPPERRARPLTFLTIGTAAGAGLAMMFGGLVIQSVGSHGTVRLPLIGSVRGWQAVFLLLGAIGFLFSGVVLSLREPARQERMSRAAIPLSEVFRYVRRIKGFLSSLVLGSSFSVLVLVSFHSWGPSMLARRFGWSASTTGVTYGACVALGSLTGILIAATAASRLASQGRTDAPVRVATIAAACGTLPLVAAPLMTSPILMLILIFLGFVGLSVVPALAPAALQAVCPNETRGQVFSIYLFVMSLLGYAAGPLIVALITDFIFNNEASANLSLSLVSALFGPLSILLLATASRQHFKGERLARNVEQMVVSSRAALTKDDISNDVNVG